VRSDRYLATVDIERPSQSRLRLCIPAWVTAKSNDE
jgi:hypothetical protein